MLGLNHILTSQPGDIQHIVSRRASVKIKRIKGVLLFTLPGEKVNYLIF